MNIEIRDGLVNRITDQSLSDEERLQACRTYICRLMIDCRLGVEDAVEASKAVGQNVTGVLLKYVAEHHAKNSPPFNMELMDVAAQTVGLMRQHLVSLYIDAKLTTAPGQPVPYYDACHDFGRDTVSKAHAMLQQIAASPDAAPGTKLAVGWAAQKLLHDEAQIKRVIGCTAWTEAPVPEENPATPQPQGANRAPR